MVSTFHKVAVVIDFYANRSELTEKYCINKLRPMLHCNGSCFLGKLLKKEEERERDLAALFQQSEVVFCEHAFPFIGLRADELSIALFTSPKPRNTDLLQKDIAQRLLKPPIC